MTQVPSASARGRGLAFLAGALLVCATAFAYLPALKGGFIWDDDGMLTQNPLIRAADGLRRFWFTAEAADYWPVTYTTLWVEWRLWGMHALGYHITNLALHIGESLLLWTILRRLRMPGAFLAALIFALHPVNVESVAWIAQRKNLMAMLFFLLSIHGFLKTDVSSSSECDGRDRFRGGRWYWLSLLAFALGMLSKGSIAMLPVVLLGVIAWRRRLVLRDLGRIAPFFLVAAVLALVDVWFQHRGQGTPIRDAGFAERALGAGAAVWFYLWKALLPFNLIFVYPQWNIRTGNPLWWMPLLAAAGMTMALWQYRGSWSRPPLFAWGYFCVMLAPVLGFSDVYFMRYSLVADHYEHLALIGVVALGSFGLAFALGNLPPRFRAAAVLVVVALVGALGLSTWAQCRTYRDLETFYRTILQRNPSCWMADNNLGAVLTAKGRLNEAIPLLEESLRLEADYPEAHNNLANALAGVPGRMPEALAHFEEALRLKPDLAEAHYNLANALAGIPGHMSEALAHYGEALRIKPDYAEAHNNLANALAGIPGRTPEALAHYEEALRLEPDYAEAHYNLANALAGIPGRTPEALAHYAEALRLRPDYAEAQNNLANALAGIPGRTPEALAHYEEALRIEPDYAEAHCNLATLLARQPDGRADAIAHYEIALRLMPNSAIIHFNLARVLEAMPDRQGEAALHYEAALKIDPDLAPAREALQRLQRDDR